jgi:hypothetical protein
MPSQLTARFTHEQFKKVLPQGTMVGNEFETQCPLCPHAHLRLYGDNGIKCMNGCETRAIVAFLAPKIVQTSKPKQATSLKPSGPGLTLQQYADAKKLPCEWLTEQFCLTNSTHDGVPSVDFPYLHYCGTNEDRLINWEWLATKYRWGMAGDQRKNKAGDKMCLYGEVQLAAAISQATPEDVSDYCFIVEGESNTQTMMYNGYATLGVPGAPTWKPEWAKSPLLEGKIILVIQDPDDAGGLLVQKIADTFPPGKVRAVKLAVKDVSDLWLQSFDPFTEFDGTLVQEVFAKAIINAGQASTVVFPKGFQAPVTWKLESITADQIKPLAWHWLWKDRVPLGCLTVFFGMAGTGKSSVAIDLAYRGSKGLPAPDKARSLPAFETLMFVSEDDVARTTVPRLKAAGGDEGAHLRSIYIVQKQKIAGESTQHERRLALDKDLGVLEDHLKTLPNVRLVVIDPISSYLGAKNQNKNEEVRPLLLNLQDLAERTRVSIVGIMHFNKNADQAGIHRISGASAWSEVPRSLWAFVPAPKEEGQDNPPLNQYLMLNGKLNMVGASGRNGIKYETVGKSWMVDGEQIETSWVSWHGTSGDVTLSDVLGEAKKPGMKPVKTESAMKWLLGYLANGEKSSVHVFADGLAAGFSKATVYEAKERLDGQVKAKKHAGAFWWHLGEVREGREGG